MNWDTSIVWAMPLWLCVTIVAVTGTITLILMWTDRRKERQ